MRKSTAAISIALFLGVGFFFVPTASAEGPAYHMVRYGETLWSLSVRYGVTLQALMSANNLVNPDWAFAGQVLVIPTNAVQRNQYHVVRAGETVFSISNRYGVSAWALVQQNGIESNLIYIGQTLVIPRDCCSNSEEAAPVGGGTSSPVRKPMSVRAAITPEVTQRKILAANPYTKGATGFDVSYPQCNRALPSESHSFIIVGINGGKAFRPNNCFASLYDWAARTSAQAPSIYMNLNYVVGSTADNGLNGPAGRCGGKEETCKAYNYGYNAAMDAFENAGARTAKMWWIDIELENTWSSSDAMNGQVIQGAIDFFQNRGTQVGIYSSADHWSTIFGSFQPRHVNQAVLPLWIFLADNRADAPSLCSAANAFGGGSPWIVQYPSNGFDGVYVC